MSFERKSNGSVGTVVGTLSAMVLVCGLAMGQDKVPQPKVPDSKGAPLALIPTPTGDQPQLVFEKVVHEFGKIPDDKNAIATFKFTNNGKADLEIKSTQASCGCTVPALAKRIYKPGEAGEISVEYHPQGKRGAQHTRVSVVSNDPGKPTIELEVKSEVNPLVMVEPMLVNLGQFVKGKPTTASAKVTSRIATVRAESATPNNVNIESKLGSPTTAEANGETLTEWPIEITMPANAPVGQFTANVAIKTNDPARLLNLTVMGEVMGDVTVNPQRVALQSLATGQDISTQFRLTSRTGKAFQVTKVEEEAAPGMPKCFANIGVQMDTSTTPPSYVVTITGRAPDKGGAVRGDLVVYTDITDEQKIRVPYFGFVRVDKPVQPRTVWDDQPSSLIPAGPR